jgi:hypothetical protein
MASVLIFQALQKGPCGANQIAYTYVGSTDKLSEQGLDLSITANKTLSTKHCQQKTALLDATKTNSTCFKSLFSS